jgi:hypothetical protein
MVHLEGVLTLVSDTGPWFRVQGRHLRADGGSPVGLRLSLDHHSGVTLDVHVGTQVWIRAGWFPAHTWCKAIPVTNVNAHQDHKCWARWLTPRVLTHGLSPST